jgi:hypothetical protein
LPLRQALGKEADSTGDRATVGYSHGNPIVGISALRWEAGVDDRFVQEFARFLFNQYVRSTHQAGTWESAGAEGRSAWRLVARRAMKFMSESAMRSGPSMQASEGSWIRPATPENQKAFDAVCDLLQAGHRAIHQDSPVYTLNRLFQKHLGLRPEVLEAPPFLTAENTTVSMERRPKPDLRALAPRKSSRPPNRLDLPVVIVRYLGHDCLIDGGSRSHHWHVNGETDDHDAWILTVADTPAVVRQ